MFAIFKTGGSQQKAIIGQRIQVEKIESAVGDELVFDQVLLINDENNETKIGTPYLQNACVKAEVIAQERHKKIRILKFKRRKHHMKSMGHRQYFTELKIKAIEG